MRRQWRLCFAVAVTSSAASGQTTQGGGTDQNAPSSITLAGEAAKDGVFDFDFTVPTSPALALAGLSQDKATVQSAALKPFVFSLPAVLSGKGGQSAALDMSPAWLFEGEGRRSYSRYTAPENYFYRLVYRTRLNAAIYNGTDDKVEAKKQKGSRLAFGVSSSLLDSSDPLMAGASDGRPSQWQQCLGELQPEVRQIVEIETPHEVPFYSLSGLADELQVASIDAARGTKPDDRLLGRAEQVLGQPITLNGLTYAQISGRLLDISQKVRAKAGEQGAKVNQELRGEVVSLGLDKALDTCATRASTVALYGAALSVGAGILYRGDPGQLDHFKRGGGALWSSFRFPVGFALDPKNKVLRYLMFGVYARRGIREYVATGDSTVPEMRANSWEVWGGVEHFTPVSKFAVQYGRKSINAVDSVDDRFSKKRGLFLVSASLPILGKSTGIWLGGAYGNAQSTVTTESDRTFMVTLEFAPPKPADIFKLNK
jgi:hypothetical protein